MNPSTQLQTIYDKVRADERLDASEALHLLQKAPWLEVCQLAAEQRTRRVGDKTGSYTVFAIINYTNICTISCSFCSYKCDEGDNQAYVLSQADVFAKIDYAQSQGADQIFLQGGVHPSLELSYYLDLLRGIKQKYDIHIRGFSPVEIQHLSNLSQLSISETITQLKNAGLDSVPGAGAEMLVERVRKILSPKKCTTAEWSEILTECHRQELFGSANIVFGTVETDAEIIEHLQVVRDIQDVTGGFNSFIPWTFQAQTKDFTVRNVPHHEYLKVLAICRLFLDNIDNLEVSVMVLGKEIGKLALLMGANDISSPVIEENVLRSFGVKSEMESRKLISAAGLRPQRRDFNYTTVTDQSL